MSRDCTFTVLIDATITSITGNCGNLFLRILNDSADSTSSSRSGCSIGDTVKILFSLYRFCVSEIITVDLLIGE